MDKVPTRLKKNNRRLKKKASFGKKQPSAGFEEVLRTW